MRRECLHFVFCFTKMIPSLISVITSLSVILCIQYPGKNDCITSSWIIISHHHITYNYQHNIYIPTPLSRYRNFSFLLMRFFVPVREYARKIFPFWGLPDNTITTLTMIETNLIHNANAVSQSPDLEGRTKIEI